MPFLALIPLAAETATAGAVAAGIGASMLMTPHGGPPPPDPSDILDDDDDDEKFP